MLENYKTAFLNPDNEYSAIPFWFWNDRLDKEEITRQMQAFKEKGVDAFVIHPRIGLPKALKYLSDEFMDYVKFAVTRAKELEMKVVLYDEAMYPSGSAHGEVVKYNPHFASKGLKQVTDYVPNEAESIVAIVDIDTATGEKREGKGEKATGVNRIYFVLTESNGTIRGIHYGEDDGEIEAPRSADLLNPEAVKCFINLTHEKYYQHLGEYFGNTIMAIFTDEPMIMGRNPEEGLIEWSDDFLTDYLQAGGAVTDLPYLFEKEDNNQKQLYKRVVKNRLAHTFYEQISMWCKQHQIQLTGHPESSQDIGLLKYFDIPCQDIVWRYVEPKGKKGITGGHSTMAKCSSDSARHHNKLRNGNECFGCCGAEEDPFLFTREDMKWYLDWLFVRGVNTIYPHAFFYSMRDRRKDERPPDVGMHSMFWEVYNEVSQYIKRMSQLLTGSTNITDIAILCTQDRLPHHVAQTLFEHQIEFNYLEEELLDTCMIEAQHLVIAKQKYHMVILEGEYDDKSYAFLKRFKAKGGIVIEEGVTDLMRAIRSNSRMDLYIHPAHSDLRRTHIRKEAADFVMLTNEGEDVIVTNLHLKEAEVVEVWDSEEGSIKPVEARADFISIKLERRKSLIVRIEYIK